MFQRRQMARKLQGLCSRFFEALTVLALAASTGCLIPADIEERDESDIREYWPVIVSTSPAVGRVEISRECTEFEFKILEYNRPPDDDYISQIATSWRWFLDYYDSTDQQPQIGGLSYSINPSFLWAEDPESADATTKVHYIEVVISDRNFDDSDPSQQPRWRITQTDARTDTATWILIPTEGPCPTEE